MSEILNFRDVGEFVNIIASRQIMIEKHLFRGGKIDRVNSSEEIGYAQTVINLRNSDVPLQKMENVKYIHFPIANKIEKYDTQLPDVRKWLNDILAYISEPDLTLPVYIHCSFGKYLTGIVVASLFWLLKIPEEIIKEEYLLSDGEISFDRINLSIRGIESRDNYFNRVDIENLEKNFLQ